MATTEHIWRALYTERRQALGDVFGLLMGRVFGCRHPKLSLPITREGRTYRVCLSCGMSRDFDPATWETVGPFRQRG